MKRLISAFLKTDLFKEIPESELMRLIQGCRVIDVPKNGLVYSAGDRFEYLVLLCSGLLRSIEIGQDDRLLAIHMVQPSQLFGLLYLFTQQARQESLIASQHSQIILVESKRLANLLVESPNAARRLCEKFTENIHALRRDKALVSRPGASSRVIGILGKFMAVEEGVHYLNRFTNQQEVACLANTTRETVSRTISQLVSAGVVQKEGPRLRVVKPEVLLQNSD